MSAMSAMSAMATPAQQSSEDRPSQEMVVDDRVSEYELWPAMTLLRDPAAKLTLAEVLARRSDFLPPKSAYATLGLRMNAVWLRIPVFVREGGDGRWIFDVELLARWRQLREHGAAALSECLYERPLDEWTEVSGSRLKATDFLKAPLELWGIYRDCQGIASPEAIAIASQSLANSTDTSRKAA